MTFHFSRNVSCSKFSLLVHYLNRPKNFSSKRILFFHTHHLIKCKMSTIPVPPTVEVIERGARRTEHYRIYYADTNTSTAISPWHDIPLYVDTEKKILNMVVEIPRWTNAKMEIATKDLMNPIRHDMKDARVRYVKNVFPHHGYIWNYGAIPQTWENPEVVDEETGFKGDNDPLDACEIGTKIQRRGTVIKVKVLGVYALIDEGETDWKLIVIDVNDPQAENVNNLEDVERVFPGLLAGTREWFRVYKVPDGKPRNKFAFNDEPKDREFALKVIDHCHEQWKDLVSRKENTYGLDLRNSTILESGNMVENPKSLFSGVTAFSPGPGLTVSEQYEIDKWHYVGPE